MNENSTPSRVGSRMPRPKHEPDDGTYVGRMALRLQELKQAAGVETAELAERMEKGGYKIGLPGLRHWEAGRRQINWEAVPVLAAALGVSPRELIPPD